MDEKAEIMLPEWMDVTGKRQELLVYDCNGTFPPPLSVLIPELE